MDNIRVWVDGTAFENENQHGVWRVFYEIMSRTSSDIHYTLWLRAQPKRPLPPQVQVFRDSGRTELLRHQWPQRLYRRHAVRRDPPGLGDNDLFHSTGFTRPLNANVRSIITVYDMIAESHFPMCIRELRESIEIKRRSFEHASLLPCISQSTVAELTSFYPQFADKAALLTLGADHLLNSQSSTTSHVPGSSQFALFVGQRMGYKNFFNVLHALGDARWPKDVSLDVVGPPWLEAETLLVRKLGLERRVRHRGVVSDSQLGELYRAARCLIFPSFQEGFGLPCLESQANGCPLVCSDIPVFHEVAGEAAIYVDSRIPQAIATAVDCLADERIRKDLVERGRENVLRFRWQDTAQRMLQLYQEIA